MTKQRNRILAFLAMKLGLIRPDQLDIDSEDSHPQDILEHLETTGVLTSEQCGLLESILGGIADSCEDDARFFAAIGVDITRRDPFDLSSIDLDVTLSDSHRRNPFSSDSLLLATPETSGRYTPIHSRRSELGRGGLGIVSVIHDKHLARDIAMKELLGTVSALPMSEQHEKILRFLWEAKITGQLEHPSIVPVHEIGRRADGTYYYTMKFVRGKTLDRAIEECHTLGQRLDLLNHFVDLCQAIAYAHSRNVIHRDIKPSNVMVGEFGETVVLDWGLAKVIGDKESSFVSAKHDSQWSLAAQTAKTLDGQMLGTPSYMSPEQSVGDIEATDERSDVWSLGAVLYKILTAKPPFVGRTELEIIRKVQDQQPPDVREHYPDVPPELAAIAHKALQKNPDKRYQNAKELSAEIGAYRSGARIKAYEYSFWELGWRMVSQHKTFSMLAGLLLVSLICGALLVILAYRRADESREIAELALTQAEQSERKAHYQLSLSLDEKALRYVHDREFSSASVAASESLIHNIYNPYSRLRHHEESDPIESAAKLAPSYSLFYQANVHTVLFCEHVMAGHTDDINRLAYSPDGRSIATTSSDGTVRLWDASTARPMATMTGHVGRVFAVAFAPDGTALLTGGIDKTLRIWSTTDFTLSRSLEAHNGSIYSLVFSPDGQKLLTTSGDGTVKLWVWPDLSLLTTIEAHDLFVTRARFSPDSRTIVSSGADGAIKIWDASDYSLVATLPHDGSVEDFDFSPDGKHLVAACHDKTVRIYNLETATLEASMVGHEELIYSVSYSPNGRTIISSSDDKTIRLWDAVLHTPITTVRAHTEYVSDVKFSPDGRHVASASWDNTAKTWELRGSKAGVLKGHQDRIWALEASNDGSMLVSGSSDQTVKLWDVATRTAVDLTPGHQGQVFSVAFSPDNRLIASGATDGSVKLWSVADRALVATISEHGGPVWGVAFSHNGELLASCGVDNTIRIFQLSDRSERAVLRGHEDHVWEVSFSPDDRLLVAASLDRTATVWDVESGELVSRINGHSNYVTGSVFSPDGTTIATSSRDATINLWDVESGELIRTFEGHQRWVSKSRFSPDGELLLSVSDDRTARLWRVDTGELVQIFWLSYEVTAVDFFEDGRSIAVNDAYDIIIYPIDLDFWQRNPEALFKQAKHDAGILD